MGISIPTRIYPLAGVPPAGLEQILVNLVGGMMTKNPTPTILLSLASNPTLFEGAHLFTDGHELIMVHRTTTMPQTVRIVPVMIEELAFGAAGGVYLRLDDSKFAAFQLDASPFVDGTEMEMRFLDHGTKTVRSKSGMMERYSPPRRRRDNDELVEYGFMNRNGESIGVVLQPDSYWLRFEHGSMLTWATPVWI